MEIPKNQAEVLEFASLGQIRNGVLTLPWLYNLDTHGNCYVWRIFIGLAYPEEGELGELPVTQELIERGEVPEGAAGYYWTEHGREGGVITVAARKWVYEGNNLGKKNYTTPFTRALHNARTEWNKKVLEGYRSSKGALKRPGETLSFEDLFHDTARGETPWRVFGMAMHKYEDFAHRIHFPATVQPKEDGTMGIAVAHPLLPENPFAGGKRIDGYTRERKTLESQEHFLRELYSAAKKFPGWYWVGEIWKKGYGLQELSGISRRKADSELAKVHLDFNIFDCFNLEKPKLGFLERQKVVDELFQELEKQGEVKYVVKIPTELVESELELMTRYREFLAEGFEGAVVRNRTAPYEFGVNKEHRSHQTLKLKPRPDAEWPVVGFTEGKKGKEVGAVVWICAENESGVKERTGKVLPLEERKTFTVTPNQSYEERRRIFSFLSRNEKLFQEKIYGEELVISYSILSKDRLPQQPKVLRFRNSKIEELLF